MEYIRGKYYKAPHRVARKYESIKWNFPYEFYEGIKLEIRAHIIILSWADKI